jgi:hypothetical protein
MKQNQTYSNNVLKEHYPKSREVPLDDFFVDDRGEIRNLLLSSFTSVARIYSKLGSVRANHYHLTDWHYAFVERGHVLYFERQIGSKDVPAPSEYSSGAMFFTPPLVEHAMVFTQDTVIYTFAKNKRSHDEHEADVKRVNFITPEILAAYIK